MARSVEGVNHGVPTTPDTLGFRHFGDGIAGPLVAARLQAYDSSTLSYIDVAVDPSGNLTTTASGGGGGTTDVTDRAARLLGHVTVDNASLAVTGTFWQTTQPVSATALPLPTGAAKDSTLTDGTQRVGGTVTVTGPLTDTQLRASAVPVSLAAVVHVDDNTGSLTVDNNGTFAVQATLGAETTKVIGTVNQGTSPWVTSFSAPQHVIVDSGTLGSVTVANSTLAVTQSTSPWVTSRNWTLSSGTDSVTVTGTVTTTEPATAADGAAEPALLKVVAGYDTQSSAIRPLPLLRYANGESRVAVTDPRVRQQLAETHLLLEQIRDLLKGERAA